MVNTSMYYVYKSWMMAEPKDRPNVVITGSGTVIPWISHFYCLVTCNWIIV